MYMHVSLQSLDWDWTGGLNWWIGLKIIFMLSDENSPVGLHLEMQPLSFTDSSEMT